jgi:hypothetical protein
MKAEKRLRKLADEIELGPSGDRQQDIAVELRAIAREMEVPPEVEAPKKTGR